MSLGSLSSSKAAATWSAAPRALGPNLNGYSEPILAMASASLRPASRLLGEERSRR